MCYSLSCYLRHYLLANVVSKSLVFQLSTAKGTNSPPAFSIGLMYLMFYITNLLLQLKLIMPGCSEMETVEIKVGRFAIEKIGMKNITRSILRCY